MSVEIARHSFTVEEFERMGEACIFPPDARLELIEGEIVEMSPIGSPHAACVDALALLFNEIARRRFIIRVQSPVRLNDFSEPQPDVALLRWRDDFYRSAHPTPADVLLVVEVSDTTVETDRKVKVPLYARAGIPETPTPVRSIPAAPSARPDWQPALPAPRAPRARPARVLAD